MDEETSPEAEFTKDELERFAFDEVDPVEEADLFNRMRDDLLQNPTGQVMEYIREIQRGAEQALNIDWERLYARVNRDDEDTADEEASGATIQDS